MQIVVFSIRQAAVTTENPQSSKNKILRYN